MSPLNDLKPLRALVIEDEPVGRHLMETVLSGRGYRVESRPDGESGLAYFESELPDLVILDLKLPGMDGLECLARLREAPGGDEAVVICVTGVDAGEALEEALGSGADDYVVKPVVNHHLDVRLSIAERQIRLLRERRKAEEALARNALHDELTGLPNRVLFMERLERAVQRSGRGPGHPVAVLVIDIDRFRDVGERWGEEQADQALVEVARRLETCVREVDSVARLHEDEFAILLDGFRDISDPTRVATRIMDALDTPLAVESDGDGVVGEIRVTAGIGLTLTAGSVQEPERLLRDAFRALTRAKGDGPGTYQMHDPALQVRAEARVQFEKDIRRAWEDGHMRLHYMPVVDIASGRVAAFEALLRWEDPERGMIPPSEFVPIAEETGLIVQMGWWTLRQGLEQLVAWDDAVPGGLPVSVGVNLSGKQFGQADLHERVMQELERSGVSPERLHLEITETAVMVGAEEAIETLTTLKQSGVRLHVDDFGTGYSSLSYLCRLPVDTLKVDRSFVSQIPGSRENLEVVRTVLQLARNLGLSVIAEGVETEQQLGILADLGCQEAQGYYFARALPAAEAIAFARSRGTATRSSA